MSTAEVLREVTLSEFGLMIAVILTIVGTIAVLRYIDRWWTYYPRRKQRKWFGEGVR